MAAASRSFASAPSGGTTAPGDVFRDLTLRQADSVLQKSPSASTLFELMRITTPELDERDFYRTKSLRDSSWKEFIRRAHPDKHSNNPASTSVFQRAQDLRRELDKLDWDREWTEKTIHLKNGSTISNGGAASKGKNSFYNTSCSNGQQGRQENQYQAGGANLNSSPPPRAGFNTWSAPPPGNAAGGSTGFNHQSSTSSTGGAGPYTQYSGGAKTAPPQPQPAQDEDQSMFPACFSVYEKWPWLKQNDGELTFFDAQRWNCTLRDCAKTEKAAQEATTSSIKAPFCGGSFAGNPGGTSKKGGNIFGGNCNSTSTPSKAFGGGFGAASSDPNNIFAGGKGLFGDTALFGKKKSSSTNSQNQGTSSGTGTQNPFGNGNIFGGKTAFGGGSASTGGGVFGGGSSASTTSSGWSNTAADTDSSSAGPPPPALHVTTICRFLNLRGAIVHGRAIGLPFQHTTNLTERGLKGSLTGTWLGESAQERLAAFGGAKVLSSRAAIKRELMERGPVVSTSFRLEQIFAERSGHLFDLRRVGNTHDLIIVGWEIGLCGECWLVRARDTYSRGVFGAWCRDEKAATTATTTGGTTAQLGSGDPNSTSSGSGTPPDVFPIGFGQFGIEDRVVSLQSNSMLVNSITWQPGPYLDVDEDAVSSAEVLPTDAESDTLTGSTPKSKTSKRTKLSVQLTAEQVQKLILELGGGTLAPLFQKKVFVEIRLKNRSAGSRRIQVSDLSLPTLELFGGQVKDAKRPWLLSGLLVV
ncbi:unnamed protein product [Amoebophrya sp. A25]|nr:unnamed protein product [Amoebophrya sp. A25]|eukprot:GSA25T00002583001.1